MLTLDDKTFYKKFPAFNLVGEVNELCQPFLNAINANYFDYNRIYKDNSFLSLSSDGHYLENFFRNKYVIGATLEQTGKHLWDSYYYNTALHDARTNFNHTHGITIFYQQPNYIEYIDIAASHDNREITSFYLNNFDYIEDFILDFTENAKHLIAIAESKLVKLPNDMLELTSPGIASSNINSLINTQLLSKRERQCLEYYFQGKTAKETAEVLQLSYRTVEEYISTLKKKLKCRHKRDLFKIFLE